MAPFDRPLFSTRLELALRRAASWHRDQTRRGSGVPYIVHPFAVAMILDRLDFPEPVVIAGLLHDAVEDTDATLGEILDDFGPEVGELVAHCSEVKTDAAGVKRPWIDRKRDHVESLASAPVEARAIALADKLHNLISIHYDLNAGRAVWSHFHAGREEVLAYYRECLDRFGWGDDRLAALVAEGREILAGIEGKNRPEEGLPR